MSGNSAVCCLSLHSLSVRTHEHTGHHTERAVALSYRVGLYVSVVVLTGPYKPALRLDAVGYHVVYQSVFIPNSFRVVGCLVVPLENFLLLIGHNYNSEILLKTTIFHSTFGVEELVANSCTKYHKGLWPSPIDVIIHKDLSKLIVLSWSVIHS